MEFCIECENESVVFGETVIKVGEKEFSLKADHCVKCGSVYLSPENQQEIDKWGNELPTTVAEFQPYFAQSLIELSEQYSKQFGLKWAEFVKVCAAFYLAEMTKEKGFKEYRSEILGEAQQIFKDAKKKTSVPVRYRLFKQLQLFSEAWDIRESNVLEEAVLFCATLLKSHHAHEAELHEFFEKRALAS